jgi:L-malate glycosyltransferase
VFAKSSNSVLTEKLEVIETENCTEYVLLYPKVKSTLPVYKEYLKFKTYSHYIKKCVDLVTQKQPIDLIHLQAIFPACIPTIGILNTYKVPLFITEHWTGYSPQDGGYNGFIKPYFTNKIIKRANKLFVVSKKQQQVMEAHGLIGNYVVLNNIVNTNIFKPTNIIKQNNINEINLLHISSLDERQKNTSTILSVMLELSKSSKKIHLNVIGGDEDRIQELKNKTKEMGIHHLVNFLGIKNELEIAKHMQQADLLLLLSNFEWTPVVISEAIACGLPVISTPVGDIENMVMDGFGVLVKSDVLQKTIDIVLNFDRTDYEDAQRMHQHIVNHYSKQVIASQLIKQYQDVIAHV